MNLRLFTPSFLVSLGVILACASTSFGQTQSNEELKATAEAALQNMTPEEIAQKLDELGISREEAIQRAAELNISLEQYLSIKNPATDTTEGVQPTEPVTVQPSIGKLPQAQKILPKKRVLVPGFVLRKGVEGLLPFGYDIFRNPPSAFEPALNVATPDLYQMGPGDQVVITVWGDTKLYYQLTVNREGNVLVPDVGPVAAFGYTLQQFRDRLLKRMSEIYSGLKEGSNGASTFLDVSIGKLRTIQVFVLGEVEKPGGYSISSMSTTLHALYLAGGPTVNGSMRSVQVLRAGKPQFTFDLYDYIIKGSKLNDARLQSGDVVFVPPAGKRAAIAGNVVRPAIYELAGTETLSDAIGIAGGLRFDAYFNRVHIERIVPFDQRGESNKNLIDLDLEFKSITEFKKSSQMIQDGDVITILKISDVPENRVTVIGTVKKPGVFELRPGMRIKDLIMKADSLDRNSFVERGNLLRLLPSLRREIIPFSPKLALAGDERNNILLQDEDSVFFYKESQFFPEHRVTISGAVRNPGSYARNENMTVADLVVIAGGVRENATTKGWEISRIDSVNLTTYSKVYKIDMPPEYWSTNDSSKFLLQDFDLVFVPANPRYSEQKIVKVSGYVLYPGVYSIMNEGERLAEIIRRAGGLRPGAYLEGSKFVRNSIDPSWSPAKASEVAISSAALVDSARGRRSNVPTPTAQAATTGWIPIDFRKALADTTSRDNIAVEEGDSVYIAYLEDLIYVKGEVFVPSAVVYNKGEGIQYYIKQAGGMKEDADGGKVVVFLPGGKKWEPRMWPFPDPEILPGSVVFVPQEVQKEDKTLPIITAWATVMASLAAITIGIVQVTK